GVVVVDLLITVARGVDVDLFGILAVLDAQFVDAATAGRAEGLEHTADLVCRQVVEHRVGLDVQAAGDQRLVGVAIQEADQHLHAHAGDGEGAVAVAGPAAGHAQPAAAAVVALAVAVPVELHLDAAVVVTVDLFTGRAGDHGALAAEQTRLGMAEGQAEHLVPRRGGKAVAVALGEAVGAWGGIAAAELFERLRLLALVDDLAEPPELVPVGARVLAQVEELPGAQQRLVAVPLGTLMIVAVALQGAL